MHITRSWHTRGGPARLTGNEPVSMSVETVRECIRRLDRFRRVWASFLCVSCAVHLLSCRLVDPELSAFEVMDPCCGAGIHPCVVLSEWIWFDWRIVNALLSESVLCWEAQTSRVFLFQGCRLPGSISGVRHPWV